MKSDLERCRNLLYWSIEKLERSLTEEEMSNLTEIAYMIINSMTGNWRHFHTTEHIFEVGGEEDPIEILAAFFHDMVYTQVDYGIHINLSGYIYPFIFEKENFLFIRKKTPDSNLFELLLLIFGFQRGQKLIPFSGQNEFLSALVAVQALSPFLRFSNLAQVAACIEATIPFRKVENGISCYDILKKRLEFVNQIFHFDWNEEIIDHILFRCVRLATRDIQNFGSPDPVRFLDNTWNLMPETNHDLRTPNSYSIADYRISMMKMLNFLKTLTPEQIFHQYKSVPSSEKLQEYFSNTRKNLRIAELYLKSKILTVGILEALSFRIGRNTPLATLIGEIPQDKIVIPTLDYFLPNLKKPYQPKDSIERIVLDVLTYGRGKDTT
ncbi:MAG: hypothetical protein N3A69_12015, partial [Leptospiraceae bacterium]|nr:hypothetical protein [Leptospiraceae bacterium]